MSRTLEMVVTSLVLDHPPRQQIHPPANFKIALMRVENPQVHFYRYLYNTIGAAYDWVDRKLLGDEELAREIQAKGVDIYVACVDGAPGGYFELDSRNPKEIWLAYLGIMPHLTGAGLGKWMLYEALMAGWAKKPRVMRVETCTLDHPRALPLYQRMGFVPIERRNKTVEVPDDLSADTGKY